MVRLIKTLDSSKIKWIITVCAFTLFHFLTLPRERERERACGGESDRERRRERHRHARGRRRRGRLLIPRHGKAGEGKRERKRGWWTKKTGEWEKTGNNTLKTPGRSEEGACLALWTLLSRCHVRLDTERTTDTASTPDPMG